MKKLILTALFLIGLSGPSVAGVVDFDPDTLNLASKGSWVTVYISALEGCPLSSINVNTIAITEISRPDEESTAVYIPANVTKNKIRDFNDDGVEELMVKFPRSLVQRAIRLPGSVSITIEGFCDSESFSGSDTIRAKNYYTVELTADLPEGISPKDVEIRSPCIENNLSNNGLLKVSGLPENPFLVVGTVNDYPVVLSFFDPGSESNGISCLDTAIALVMVANHLYSMPSNIIPEVLGLIRSAPAVQDLAVRVCLELSISPDALLVPSAELLNAVKHASKDVDDALSELIDNGGNPTAY